MLKEETTRLADADLVHLAQSSAQHRVRAEQELCRRLLPRIRLVLARELYGTFELDDIAHDVVVSLLQAVRTGQVRTPDAVGEFALGICRNKVREVIRERHRRTRALGRIEPTQLLEMVMPRVKVGRLEECLHKLRAQQRTLLRMTFLDGLTAPAAGKELSLSAENVRVMRHRTIEQLRQCLQIGRYEVEQR